MTTLVLVDPDNVARSRRVAELQSIKSEWKILHTDGGVSAMQLLKTMSPDCVISDSHLSDIGVFDLLNQIKQLYPDIIRFTISDNPDQEVVLESARANHRFINKSLDTTVLIACIECSMRLKIVLSDKKLRTQIQCVQSLPSLPVIYNDMLTELAAPHSSLLKVGRIVETDAGLTATVLKIVNSAFYGLSQRVESVAQAVALLGVHLIKNIALTAKVFSIFEGNCNDLQRLTQLNTDACTLGALTNQFARHARVSRSAVDHSQIAGMLANVGELIALTAINRELDGNGDIRTEMLGAYLLRDWLMPDPIVEAVALQYESPPRHTETLTPLIILHAIRYLQANLTKVDDPTQYAECQEYLEQFIDSELTILWLNAYQDLHLLTGGSSEAPTNRAA